MRLVSLCPSITETLVALGAGGDLVGVTRYCVRPREALSGIPKVGGTKTPDIERILALRPDRVFLNEEENRREDAEALAAHVEVDVTFPRAVGDVPELIRHLGRGCGRPDDGVALARRVEEALGDHEPPARAFRFAYLIWKGPWMLAGAGTYISSLLEAAGGVNVATSGPYPEVSEDELSALRPELLLLPDEPYRFSGAHLGFWSGRLPGCEVQLVSGDDFCWHGVRTLDGLRAARQLAGALAAGVAP
jgi:ABC-type Fe3+-hydroxamate transport system substrate-binding protein